MESLGFGTLWGAKSQGPANLGKRVRRSTLERSIVELPEGQGGRENTGATKGFEMPMV